MAPPFTLKLGSLSLAPYVRVGNDEGFDPYDGGGFEEPAFIDNPFGEGQGLANVDSRNREMSWPLYLNAATKDAMHTLVRQINQEIRYAARPLRVEWRDQDATNSTYYDVEYARFDPNFRMRPSAQKWLAGVLRVWTKPYGHTATARVCGTAVATLLPHTTVSLASYAGDVEPICDARLKFSYRGAASGGMDPTFLRTYGLLSSIPSGWPAFWPAASIVYSAIAGASGAIGSQVVVASSSSTFNKVGLAKVFPPQSLASVAAGERMRVIAIANAYVGTAALSIDFQDSANPQGAGATALLRTQSVSGPVPINGYELVDLGCFTFEPRLATSGFFVQAAAAGASITTARLCGLYIVPEESTRAFKATGIYVEPNTAYAGGSHTASIAFVDSANQVHEGVKKLLEGDVRGDGLRVTTARQVFAMVHHSGLAGQNQLDTEIRLTERFTFAR